MGLFSFGKKVKLYAPVDGTLAGDQVASGFTITPERHHVFSPVEGTISALSPEDATIRLTAGKLTISLQLGVDTGLVPSFYVHEGDQVTPESPLAFMDQEGLAASGEQGVVRVAVDNAATHVKSLNLSTSGQVQHDQEVATVVAK